MMLLLLYDYLLLYYDYYYYIMLSFVVTPDVPNRAFLFDPKWAESGLLHSPKALPKGDSYGGTLEQCNSNSPIHKHPSP